MLEDGNFHDMRLIFWQKYGVRLSRKTKLLFCLIFIVEEMMPCVRRAMISENLAQSLFFTVLSPHKTESWAAGWREFPNCFSLFWNSKNSINVILSLRKQKQQAETSLSLTRNSRNDEHPPQFNLSIYILSIAHSLSLYIFFRFQSQTLSGFPFASFAFGSVVYYSCEMLFNLN